MDAVERREKPEAVALLEELWPSMSEEKRNWIDGWLNAVALNRSLQKEKEGVA